MIELYKDSIAPGTRTNRIHQAKIYLTFAVHYGLDPLNPLSSQLCMYAQFLKNSYAAPTTVKNYLSGARTWLAEHAGDLSSFFSIEYRQLVNGLTKKSSHVPTRAAPLTWNHIRTIVSFLQETPGIPASVKPCILIGYYTFLRSSNLLSPSVSVWGGPHTLTARDLKLTDQGLSISVTSTKTKADPSPVTTLIPWQQDAEMCPAAAWFRYATQVGPSIVGPAFITNSGLPLTPRIVVGLMRIALSRCSDIDASRVSMHSLRRGAVQSAVAAGVDLNRVKERGMWKSDTGFAPYLS